MLEYAISIFLCLIDTVSTLFICDSFLLKKKYKRISAVYLIVLTIISFVYLWNITSISVNYFLRMAVVFLLYLIMLGKLFNGSIAAKATIVAITLVLFYTIDMISVGLTIFIFDISYSEIINFNEINIIVSMLSKAVSLSLSIILNKINIRNKRESKLSLYEWIQLLLYPLVTLLVLLVFIESALAKSVVSPLMLISIMAIIVANIIIFIVINRLENDKRIKEENVILQQQIKTEMNNVVALVDAYDEQRKMTHDFSNHLSIIESLAEQNEFGRLNTYISNLSRNLKDNSLPVKTNNLIIDAILNQKYNIAVKNNIMMEFYINDLSRFPMKDEDLVIVLTNALDNALEACLKLSGNKIIQTKITDSDTDAIISIKNTYSQELYEKQKLIKSKMVSIHGYGMKNISTIVKKYDAYLATKNDDMWFQITVRIPKQ